MIDPQQSAKHTGQHAAGGSGGSSGYSATGVTVNPAPQGLLPPRLLSDLDPVAVILSPPRSGSTVLARSLWQHRAFRWYLHEPCDRAYHLEPEPEPEPEPATNALVDRRSFSAPGPTGTGVVIKEMTFQAGDAVSEFQIATVPVVFLIRDPRLAVLSRMRRRELDGDSPSFPAKEAGWHDLLAAIALFRAAGTPYVIVDSSDIRRNPGAALHALCRRLGLPWDPAMLRWRSLPYLSLGNIEGRQDAWYARVLRSTTWEQPDETMPGPDVFRKQGMSAVVAECLDGYRRVRMDPQYLGVGEPTLMSFEGWDI